MLLVKLWLVVANDVGELVTAADDVSGAVVNALLVDILLELVVEESPVGVDVEDVVVVSGACVPVVVGRGVVDGSAADEDAVVVVEGAGLVVVELSLNVEMTVEEVFELEVWVGSAVAEPVVDCAPLLVNFCASVLVVIVVDGVAVVVVVLGGKIYSILTLVMLEQRRERREDEEGQGKWRERHV